MRNFKAIILTLQQLWLVFSSLALPMSADDVNTKDKITMPSDLPHAQLRGNTKASQDVTNAQQDTKGIEDVVPVNKDASTTRVPDCSQATDGCTSCKGSTCQNASGGERSANFKGGRVVQACISSFGMLQSALNDFNRNYITLCPNTVINVNENNSLTTSRDNLTINCNGGNCTIRRTGGEGRVMTLYGSFITLTGITFEGGEAATDGGGLYIQGTGNLVQNCRFMDNLTTNGRGGAAYIGGGTVTSPNGSQNSAPTCNGVYVQNIDQCRDIFDGGGYYYYGGTRNFGYGGGANYYGGNRNFGYGGGANYYGGNRNYGYVGGNNSQCGLACISHLDCFGVCSECDVISLLCVNPNLIGNHIFNNCGAYCQTHVECRNKAGPCTQCDFAISQCFDPNNRFVNPGSFRTCVSGPEALKIAMQQEFGTGDIVEICAGSDIVLTGEITSNVNNLVLRCQNNAQTCTIRRDGGGAFRLLKLTGDDVQVFDIIFSGGEASSGDGGAIQLTGDDAKVTNCQFNGNRASSGRGGAIAMKSGNLINNSGSGNYAAQCTDAYRTSTGDCSGLNG